MRLLAKNLIFNFGLTEFDIIEDNCVDLCSITVYDILLSVEKLLILVVLFPTGSCQNSILVLLLCVVIFLLILEF